MSLLDLDSLALSVAKDLTAAHFTDGRRGALDLSKLKGFVDEILDAVIRYGPIFLAQAKGLLRSFAALDSRVQPIVDLLDRVPADQIVEVLQKVRTLI